MKDISIKIMFGILLVALFFMGLEIDVRIIWVVLKKPIGPSIGLVCQFLFMPLCAYAIAKGLLLNGAPFKIQKLQYWVHKYSVKHFHILLIITFYDLIIVILSSRTIWLDTNWVMSWRLRIKFLDSNV